MAGLLGASPGASTAVPAMIDVLKKCFDREYPGWEPKLKEMVPSLGVDLAEDTKLFDEVWDWTSRALQLRKDDVPGADQSSRLAHAASL
jgi:malate dehydrogenase (quinone)